MLNFCFYEIRLLLTKSMVNFGLFFFFLIIIPLFFGLWQDILHEFSLAILWTSIIFSFLLDSFLVGDWDDGSFEFYFLSKYSIHQIFILKILTNWFFKIIGILFSYPILSLFYHFTPSIQICFTLILGSLLFMFISTTHSLFTIGAMSGNDTSLLYLTTLPTLIPIVLLCSSIYARNFHWVFLIGFLIFYILIYNLFLPAALRFLLCK